jgi:cell division protein FtsN
VSVSDRQDAQPRLQARQATHPGRARFQRLDGLGAGLAIGLAVAFGVHLHYQNLLRPCRSPRPDAPPASAQAPEEPAALADAEATLRLLRHAAEAGSGGAGERPAEATARQTLAEGDITLQAGSFKHVAEAEKLQAKLAQYGVDAKIQRFSLEDETWYRVRIGPIATVEDLDAVRTKLAEAEVDAMPVTAVAVPPP